jgi:hypothetical protein
VNPTLKRISEIFGAHMRLNGRTRVIETDGKATGSVFETFGKFSKQTKTNVVRNITILRPHAEKLEEQRKELIKLMSPDGTGKAIDADAVLSAQFNEALEEIQNRRIPVKLLQIEWNELEIAGVDPVTIAQLGSIVRSIPPADDKDLLPDSAEQGGEDFTAAKADVAALVARVTKKTTVVTEEISETAVPEVLPAR